jgi:Cu/Ag efflux protein CusF
MARTCMIIAMLLWLPASLAHAQQTVTKQNVVTGTATITAIEPTTRHITLKNEKGEEDSYTVGPEVTRFNELKVGDKIRMTYYESLVFQLRKPGDTANPAGDDAAVTRTQGGAPGATIASQMKRTVTVASVDPATGSITVKTEDGRTVTRKVDDKKNLADVKPGDRIDITYTEAIVTGVENAK